MIPFLRIASDLLFPPCCVGCGKRLRPSMNKEKTPYFCPVCALEFEKSLLSQCPNCFAPYCKCECQPYSMKRVGSKGLIKLAPYHKEEHYQTVSHAIHSMKRTPRARVFNCCAESLADPLLKAVRALDEETTENAELSENAEDGKAKRKKAKKEKVKKEKQVKENAPFKLACLSFKVSFFCSKPFLTRFKADK